MLRSTLVMVAFTLPALVLVCDFSHNESGPAPQGANPMRVTSITVQHIQVVADKPFDQASKAFEQQLGQFNEEVYKSLAAGEDLEKARAKLEAMVGPSGFMLFRTSDHGSLLRLVGQKKKAIQYLVGNPLFAIQMTQHDIRASLYAPLAGADLRERAGKDLRGIRQAVVAVRTIRQREGHGRRHHARSKT